MFKAQYSIVNKPRIGASIKRGHPLTRFLYACYLLNEGRGRKVHDIVNNQHGDILGNSYEWIGDDKFGIALKGTGTNAYINTSILSFSRNQYPNGLTFELWINFTSTASRNDLVGVDDSIEFFTSVLWCGGGTDLSWNVPSNNIWSHLVATFGPTGKAVYKNGLLDVKDTNNTWGATSANPVRIGGGVSGGIANFINGKIGLVRIWNRWLHPQEINQLYRDPYAMIQ